MQLDAAFGFTQTRDFGNFLRRSLGEHFEEFLCGDAGSIGDLAQCGRFSRILSSLAAEVNNLPVIVGQGIDAFALGNGFSNLLGPFTRVGHETFSIQSNTI